MTNKELQNYLATFPENMPVRIMPDHKTQDVIDLNEENIMHTSETAFINREASEDEWDCEDGKVELGNGKQYLLINPIIV